MPLEVHDLRAETVVPAGLTGATGGWDRPQFAHATAEVRRILRDVAADGDRALVGHLARLDSVTLRADQLRVTVKERDKGAERVGGGLLKTLGIVADNIRTFHEAQLPSAWSIDREGVTVGQVFRPLRRVGLYAPRAKGALASTVLMTAIPAQVAGVDEIVLCTGADEHGVCADAIMAAAKVAGITEIYRVTGPMAMAAMAYGTATIEACDKICGPGNVYTTLAKRELYGTVGIDGLFGPSESMVVADDRADPVYAAVELLTQAEHDTDAAAILVTTSPALLEATLARLEERLRFLPKSATIRDALATNGVAILVRDLAQAADVVNMIAPEHVCIQTAEPEVFLESVRAAGCALLGDRTPAALSDYCAGPSHVLPTARAARYSSGLSVRDFLVGINTVSYSDEALWREAPLAEAMATAEELEAHRQAILARLDGQ